jgi:hypothetical protein
MVFFVISSFRDFVIKNSFLFPDKRGFSLCINPFIWLGIKRNAKCGKLLDAYS